MFTLYDAFAEIKNENEFKSFLTDLCTPTEIRELTERWQIAQLLFQKKLSQRAVAEKLGVSITTVTRVARFLKDEPYQGYAKLLARLFHA